MIRKGIILALSVFNVVEQGIAQDTLFLYPTKDTYINTTIPDLYQGNTQGLVASTWTYGGTPGLGHSLIGFTLPVPSDSLDILQANLYLYYDDTSPHVGHTVAGLNSASLFMTSEYWDESTTWSNRPSFDTNLFSTVPHSSASNQNYVIDITELVTNSVTEQEVGLYLKLNDEELYRSLVFASRDHPKKESRPRLEIIYNTEIATSLPEILTANCPEDVEFPNVFTPNHDGLNDQFKMYVDCHIDLFTIRIYDRWGRMVYQSHDPFFKWSGSHSPNGTYFYNAVFTKEDIELQRKGNVMLLR